MRWLEQARSTIESPRISPSLRAPVSKANPASSLFLTSKSVSLALGDDVFYYPDVMVGCDPRDTHRLYLRYPNILVEVSSESTERLDRGEKRLAYQTIETL